jgi:serine/threonine-protein kinase
MALTIGSQLGSHEIVALLGKGGMGEVYRARDLKLKREVAIKILPEEFSRDSDRISRFQREAEVLASLNHPNIAGIYDLAEASGTRFLVLELVEGETLADRILRGPIPVREALKIAIQICEALEAAHERGIIHRDLKPANVKLTADGKVKVLDFGLAKAMESTPASPTLSNSPTLLSGSMSGMIVGTAAYMSPEQAKGRAVDRRTDIFAFGCVLYEMLTGKRTFDGDDVTDILGAVLRIEPDWSALPKNSPVGLRNLLRLCLEKNVKNRRSDATDLRLDIEQVLQESVNPAPKPIELVKQPFWKRALFAVVLILVGAVIATVITWQMRPLSSAAIILFSYVLPTEQGFTGLGRHILTLSPDGSNLVFVGNSQLYLKRMSDLEAKSIPGTMQQINTPFFSPDGNWIGFFVIPEGKLKKIAISGGASVEIADVSNPYGATWYAQDSILVGQGPKGIIRVPAGGGKSETVIPAKKNEVLQTPQVLPGGDEVLFTVAGTTGDDRWDKAQIVVQSLKTGKRKPLGLTGSDARYVPTGHIVYAVGSNLFAVAFDAKKLHVTSGPVSIIQDVMGSRQVDRAATAATFFSFSSNGHLAYVPVPSAQSNETVTLVDLAGTRKVLALMPGKYSAPRISPDGKQVALEVQEGKDVNIVVYDLEATSEPRALTFGGKNISPVWTHNSQRIIYQSDRDGDRGIFWQRADGSDSPARLTALEKDVSLFPDSVSPDGKIAFRRDGAISILSLDDQKIKAFIPRPPNGVVANGAFSKDGHWFAYQSSENLSFQIYVQRFPTGGRFQITTKGNNGYPLWSPDGKRLFYAHLESSGGVPRVMAADVQTEPTFKVLKTTPLLVHDFLGGPGQPRNFDTFDGKQFVVLLPPEQSGAKPAFQINTVLNWFEELKQRAPVH